MRKLILAAALIFASACSALAQSNPGLRTGQVPTAAQWNTFFSTKQDFLGFTPLNPSSLVGAAPISVTSGGGVVSIGMAACGANGFYVSTGSAWQCSTAAGSAATLNGGPLTINPTASTLTQGFNITQTVAGVSSATPSAPDARFFVGNALNNIYVSSYNANDTAGIVAALAISMNMGGNQTRGSGVPLIVSASMTSEVTHPANVTGAIFIAQSAVNLGGTSGTPDGSVYGLSVYAIANGPGALTGATNLINLTGGEINVGAYPGSSVFYKSGLQIVNLANDGVQGSSFDIALSLSNIVAPSATTGWKTGLGFSAANGNHPIATNGTLIGTIGAATVSYGVNISSYTCSTACWSSNGATISGSGSFQSTVSGAGSGSGVIVASNNPGISLDYTAGGADAKWWDFNATAGAMRWRILNDAQSVATTVLSATRTGTTVVSVEVPSSLLQLGSVGVISGTVQLLGITSGSVNVAAQAVAGSWTFQLPTTAGTANYALITNGAGISSWSILPTTGGGTGLASGTSGGVLYFNSTTTIASSALLAANAIVLGGGAGTAPATLGSLGTTTTVLHGNAGGAPTFGSVVSADMNITTTSCTNQFVTAISAGGVGTCTSDILASAQHANQGTTTTVLHGNAAGNPTWAQVSISADISGLGTNMATFLGTPSSANLAAAVTDETGTGPLMFGIAPTITTNYILNSASNVNQVAINKTGGDCFIRYAYTNSAAVTDNWQVTACASDTAANSTWNLYNNTLAQSPGSLSLNISPATMSLRFTTEATATNAAAFVLSGGAGIAKNVYIGGQIFVTSMTQTSAAQSGSVCYNSGTGAVNYDATLGCLASSGRYKTIENEIKPQEALSIALRLVPVSYHYRRELKFLPTDTQVGFAAEQVATVDSRLTAANDNGEVMGVRYQQLTAILAGAIQQLKADNDNNRADNDNIKQELELLKRRASAK